MRDSTKLFIETELNNHIKVDMEACAKSRYDWFEYFIPGKLTNNIIPDRKSRTSKESIIQSKIVKTLFCNDVTFSEIENAQLYLDPNIDEDDINWDKDPGYDVSYSLGGDCYLVLEGKNADYIFKIETDFYCPEEDTENAEFIGKFE